MRPAFMSTTEAEKQKCRECRAAVDVLMPIKDVGEVSKTRTLLVMRLYR